MLANLLWRAVRYGMNPPLWGDEAMLALSLQSRPISELLSPLMWSQLAPPAFLWISDAMTTAFGFDERILRLWPMLAGTLATVLFALLAWRHLRRREALLATAVLAASYFPLRHSVELKPYSGDLLVAVSVLLLTLELARRATGWKWFLFAVVASVAVWLSFPAIFVIGGCGVWLLVRFLVRGDRANAIVAVVVGLLVLASFAGMYVAFSEVRQEEAEQYRAMEMWDDSFPPMTRPWVLPWWLLETHAGRMLSYPAGGKNFGSTATLLLCIVGGVKLYRAGRKPLLWLLLAPLGVGLIAAMLGQYPYGGTARTMLYAAPSICLLGGIGLVAAFTFTLKRKLDYGVLAFCGLMFLAILGGAIGDVIEPYKTDADRDTRRILRQLAREAQPGDVWVFARGRASASGRENEREVLSGISASATQFYAQRWSPATLRIAPPPESIDRANRIWLLAHERPGEINPRPVEEVLMPYLAVLGEPAAVRAFPVGNKGDLLVYEFAPSTGSR